MGAPLHSGRKEKFGIISDLRDSEVLILKHMIVWDYKKNRATTSDISKKLKISNMTAWQGLKYLHERGLAQKSRNGSWFLLPLIRKDIIDNLTEGELSELLQIDSLFMEKLEADLPVVSNIVVDESTQAEHNKD